MSNAKEFLKQWRPKNLKKMDKDDRINLLYDNIPGIVNYYVKKSHADQEFVNELFDRMQDESEKFPKTLIKILKSADETPIELGLAVVIADFLERRHDNISEDMTAMYGDIIDKILKKRVKKLSKKLDMDKDLIKELLVVVPDKQYISDKRFVGIYVQRILRKLYILARDNDLKLEKSKNISKLFRELFDEDLLTNIAVNVLLERKESMKNFNEKQLAIWNLMTAFALDTLEDMKKKEIREQIEYYVLRRHKDAEKGRDHARRVTLTQLADDSYSKISDVVEELADKEKFKKYL